MGRSRMRMSWVLMVALVLGCQCSDPKVDDAEDEGTDRTGCPGAFHHRCHCGVTSYEDMPRALVVNCTGQGFDTADALQHLPSKTEVLIFMGNNIPEMHWNVFGQTNDYEALRVVDMSSNNIHEIKGKTYHKVGHVERLILNHNYLNISLSRHHPRMFSNFVHLRSLHLTNAFADGQKWRVEDLKDIFFNSNLSMLEKIHLEQNEIVLLDDPRLFCDLPSLMDLHLGDNHLVDAKLDLDCLPKLRYIDLERNNIQSIDQGTLDQWDRIAAHALVTFRVNLDKNPFDCDCRLKPFADWLTRTKVDVFGKQKLRCHTGFPEENAKKRVVDVTRFDCPTVVKDGHLLEGISSEHQNAANAALGIFVGGFMALALILAYMKRDLLRGKLRPVVDTVTRRVRYSSIGKVDEPEVEV